MLRIFLLIIFSVDHGLDSWSTVPFTITIFSVFGRGEFRYALVCLTPLINPSIDLLSVSPVHLLAVLISVQVVFIVTHWEKYNTGVLFLSWGYDASQYVSASGLDFYLVFESLALFQLLTFVYLFTYFVGYKWYKFYVFGDITLAVVFEMSFYCKFYWDPMH